MLYNHHTYNHHFNTNQIVIHACPCRDLKSGNLLVDQDNMVRVADFGLSRLYHGMHTMTGGLGTFQVRRGFAVDLGVLRLPPQPCLPAAPTALAM
jgi:hypothetical protein